MENVINTGNRFNSHIKTDFDLCKISSKYSSPKKRFCYLKS